MNTQTPKQTQLTQQTQLVSSPGESGDESEVTNEEKDELIWGRLFAIGSAFKSIDLKKDITTFGRRTDCDVNLNVDSNLCLATAYSNLHFSIKREFSIKTGSHALLVDNSSNGTFINGEKIGKGRVQALKSNNEISLSKKENKAFIFIDLSQKEDKNWPPEITKKYTITKTLGVGAYGEVRLAFEKHTCEKFAVKIISKRKFTINGKHQNNVTNQINAEITILKKLEHPCIIKIKDVIETVDTVFIVLDLVEGGELFDKLIKLGQYDEFTAKLLFYQMVLAIKYLHEMGVSHRDLKPENILLCSNETNHTLVKISDFGLSKFFDSTALMKTFCGTPNYLAPEVLLTKGEGTYTNKIDNWSLGVILYICLVGYPPFSDENPTISLENQIKKGLYDFPKPEWDNVSRDAIDLVTKLLCVDPNRRFSLEQVLEHKWIKNDVEMRKKAHSLMNIEEDKIDFNENKKRESNDLTIQDNNNNHKKLKPNSSTDQSL